MCGKLEKSSGLNVCNATIKTNKETNKFDVKRRSKINGLRGITIIAIKIIIPIGILKVLINVESLFSFKVPNANSMTRPFRQ